MYEIYNSNKKVEKKIKDYISIRKDMIHKLKMLKENPRRHCGAHPLHGELKGRWACWFGSNVRMIYSIDDKEKIIWIDDVGTHKIY